jgi:hypothetical protein
VQVDLRGARQAHFMRLFSGSNVRVKRPRNGHLVSSADPIDVIDTSLFAVK